MLKRKATVSIRECVAWGCCIKVYPKNDITIPKGVFAKIDIELCVGCGKCAKESFTDMRFQTIFIYFNIPEHISFIRWEKTICKLSVNSKK